MSHYTWSREQRADGSLIKVVGPPKAPIRLADEHDELGVIEMFKMAHSEQPYHSLDVPKVAAHIRLAIQPGAQRRGIIGVIGERHNLLGGIFLLMEQPWSSQDWRLMEYFNYVRPEARRSTYGSDLIAYAQKCSDDIGIDLAIGVFSTVRTEAKCRLYRRRLKKVGEFYLHAPPNRQGVYERIRHLNTNAVAAE